MSEQLQIRSRDGLTLEGVFDGQPEAGTVVFCHPHPRFGGTMDAPLLGALRDELVAGGFGVLRFNFRGVGASEGEPGLGVDEVADAAGALDLARERAGDKPTALLGWSFGGAVAIRAAAQEDVAACVAIAPAVGHKEGISAGLPDPGKLGFDKPLLVIIGSNDEVISPEACEQWTAVAGGTFVEMAGANHFFWARYGELSKKVSTWLREVLA